MFRFLSANAEELADTLKHEGIRAGEIVAYRAWRVILPGLFRRGDNLLHSVHMRDYIWLPDVPASGDVKMHGIYLFKQVIRSAEEYDHETHAVFVRKNSRSGAR